MEKKQRNKMILVGTTIVLVLIFIIGTTLAYLTEAADTLNRLKVGRFKPTQASVQINSVEDKFREQIKEQTDTMGSNFGHFKADKDSGNLEAALGGLIPGEGINKDPTIVNIGVEEVYLRMRVLDKEGKDAFQNQLLSGDVTTGKGLGLKPAGHWIKRGDYYYYSEGKKQTGTGSALDVGDKLAIFDYSINETDHTSMQVPITWNWDHEAFSSNIELTVEVQAIQYRYFDPDIALQEPWQYVDGQPVELIL